MTKNEMPGLGRGERAPDFVLPLANGTPTRFYAKAGGSITLLIFGDVQQGDELSHFTKGLNESGAGVPIFLVKSQNADMQTADADEPAMPVFSDVEGNVRTAYRLAPEEASVVFVLDPNLRVLASLFLGDSKTAVREVAGIVKSMPPRKAMEAEAQAPVLVVPNILDAGMCRSLIDVWHNEGSEQTGVEQSQGDRRAEALNPDLKRRRDHIVKDPELLKLLTMTIGRRLMPEVRKAFAFQATRFEGFKIVCYEAESGGFFDAHRDNLSPATAHRRFALTLNLNDDYEGGFLIFREYGPHLYRPEAGNGLVFSCSHLHEVTAVKKGRRFALLSFLFRESDMRPSPAKAQNS